MKAMLRSQSPASTRVVILAVLLLVAALAGARGIGDVLGEAQAHIKFSNGDWVFRGRTIDSSGDRSDKKDPITIVFKGHDREYSNDNVFDHIADHTGWGGTGLCNDHQRVVWKKPNSNETTSDKDDFQLDNRLAVCFASRWHLRGWDDQEHYRFTSGHGRANQWTVAGVHHESGPPHEIDMDWDVARRRFVNKMSPHCRWPKWKRHPGARGEIYHYYNSGWIGRISLKHGPDC